jgi:hypothetical protein
MSNETNEKPTFVFLGGTCGKNDWRKALIKRLVECGVDPAFLFDPVVPVWNDEAAANEEEAKTKTTHFLFYLANPKEEGNSLSAYSMQEATMALYDNLDSTVVVYDTEGMPAHATKAMNQSLKILKKRFPTANIFATVSEAEDWLVKNLVVRS